MVNRLLLVSLLLLAGCTQKTDFGYCVGIFDKEDANLMYKLDAGNIAIGLIFSEFIVPPIVVLTDEIKCPVGRK